VAQVRLASTTVQNVVTYSVMIQAANPRQMLIPGMTANVRIVTDRRENALRVPNDAARFQPPQAKAANNNQGGFAGGGNGGGNNFQGGQGNFNTNDLVKQLGLSEEQVKKFEKAREELVAQIRTQQGGGSPAGLGGGGGFGGGGGNFNFNNGQGQAIRNRFENMMASVLTPEQLEKFRALRSQRGGQPQTRQGTLWTLEGGVPKSHQVRLGVADDRFTELVEGDLKEGAQVIVRARTEVAK